MNTCLFSLKPVLNKVNSLLHLTQNFNRFSSSIKELLTPRSKVFDEKNISNKFPAFHGIRNSLP
jgi:hypothetical protein